MAKPPCFVVRPIHKRSNYVVHVYIRPACQDDWEVVPAGTEASAAPITEDIFRHLEEDPLVIAYLHSPARMEGEGNKWFWNPNVMLEAGYRMGLKLPIIFVRDCRRAEDEPLLPFDLANLQVVELPEEQKERDDMDLVEKAVGKMKSLIRANTLPSPTPVPHPVFPAPSVSFLFDQQGGRVKSASDDAAEFFGVPRGRSLTGMPVADLLRAMYERILPRQRDPFNTEQARLVGEIFMGRRPMASVCLAFGAVDLPPGSPLSNAYLPVVARFLRQGGTTTLDVIYLDVSEIAKLDSDGVIRCRLGQSRRE